MTADDATVRAREMWGLNGMCSVTRAWGVRDPSIAYMQCEVGYLDGSTFVVQGRGGTWSDAFDVADSQITAAKRLAQPRVRS